MPKISALPLVEELTGDEAVPVARTVGAGDEAVAETVRVPLALLIGPQGEHGGGAENFGDLEGVPGDNAALAAALAAKADSAATTATLAMKAPLASPALTGNPTAPTQSAANNSTRVATTAYVDSAVGAVIAASDAMVFKGVVDCSANPNYPAADRGWTYKVSVAGKIGGGSGQNVEVGDCLLCVTDGTAAGTHASVGAQWAITQTNLDGAVIGPASSVNNRVAVFSGASGKLIADSGLTLSGTNTGDQTTITGNAGSATVLQTGRTFAMTGDVVWSPGSFNGSANMSAAGTIAAGAVSYSKMQNVSATDRILGRFSAGAGVVEEITCTAAGRALIDDADAAAQRTTLGLGSAALSSASVFVSAAGGSAANISITGYTEAVSAPAAGTAFSPDLSVATQFYYNTSGNCTITMPAPVAGKSFTITVNYGGAHTLSWAGGAREWAGGSIPTPTSVSGKKDIFTFNCADGLVWDAPQPVKNI